eukprot:UN21744
MYENYQRKYNFLVTKSGENQTQYHFEKISRLLIIMQFSGFFIT